MSSENKKLEGWNDSLVQDIVSLNMTWTLVLHHEISSLWLNSLKIFAHSLERNIRFLRCLRFCF